MRVAIIGAGVGGLSAAAALAKAGVDVAVLEAHIYPGGCAGTFYYQGYRFDAGATLAAGFYPGGPMDLVAAATGIDSWEALHADPAMVVHLPGGIAVPRWGDERRWPARQAAFGSDALPFFQWQENRADALWSLALRGLPWPPQSAQEALALAAKGIGWAASRPSHHLHPSLLTDAGRKLAARLDGSGPRLRLFVDAQLLISAQATSGQTNALYGAAALDLPRRGSAHIPGGMGAISQRLVQAIRVQGGQVQMRRRVERIRATPDGGFRIQTNRGEPLHAKHVILNLPPWNIRGLLENPLPKALRNLPQRPDRGWGAFTLYLGVADRYIPEGIALHHQVVQGASLIEGESIFISISPEWDSGRAPAGRRAITVSTHTRLEPWWSPASSEPEAYQRMRTRLRERVLAGVERILPGVTAQAELTLDGTPRTFANFTGRSHGWVGGFPQTDLFQHMAPRLSDRLWVVGDSIFPGQSTAAVALGGLRVAQSVLQLLGRRQG